MKSHWYAILLLAAVCGCNAESPEGMSSPVEVASTPEPAPAEVTTKVMDYTAIQMLIESYRGKVVVVDYWSTNCPPCIRELPGLVKLSQEFPASEVKCVTVSLDYTGAADEKPEDSTEAVMRILKHVDARFDNIIAADDSEAMLKKLDLSAPPAVYVYGKDGKLAKRFDNENATGEGDEFTYAKDVQPLVAELTQKK
ncbi:TlpA disulfide reductase family protein [Bremerella cremea]|uniref:TlpA family protein disulfide reductase n=1 Tax=Bremerella cremea TaxID=1031537 RepID=UPI0031ECD6BA